MSNLINLIILILSIQNNGVITDSVCSLVVNSVFCSNFNNFNEITFDASIPNITSITIIPNNKLLLNNELRLEKLIVEKNFNFIFSNLNGLELVLDPFGKQSIKNYAKLYFSNTIFDLYDGNNLITTKKCNDLVGEFEINLFVLSNFVSLKENITYANKLCPVLFQESELDTFELYYLKEDNRLVFEQEVDATGLNSKILNFKIFNSFIYLDNSLLQKDVFKMTQNVFVLNSNLTGIQENLFQHLTNLKYLELELNNFHEFIQNQDWMLSLNSNSTEIYIKLTDLKKEFIYSQKDFCLFKNFPHSKFGVFPIINTKSDLECTCTLLWLLQYNKLATNKSLLETDSTRNCLTRPDFDVLIENCRFQQTIFECGSSDQKCSFKDKAIICNNFTSFSQLNFTDSIGTYDSISLFPNEPLNLDSSLDFQTLSFSNDNFTVKLNKINRFNMENNPFALLGLKNGTISLDESTLDFYNDNNLIDTLEECDSINRNDVFVAFFDCYQKISFEENVIYPQSICPIHFKNADLDLLEVYNLKKDNTLNFMQLNVNDSISDLNCKVKKFIIYKSDVYLNDNLVFKEIFKSIQELKIIASKLNGIKYDLFQNFNMLKRVVFEITNFKQFSTTNTSWMLYLNGNVKVNLNDPQDIYNNKGNEMFITLTDDYSLYTYPDEDFCVFKIWPHSKLVYPIINTKPNLDCSCTLLWLIQYKDIYPETSSLMQTDSVYNCINRLDFNDLIQKCDFKTRLDICNGVTTLTTTPTTTTTTTTTSKTSLFSSTSTEMLTSSVTNTNNDSIEVFKGLSIAFIVLTIFLSLLLGFALSIIYRNRFSLFQSLKSTDSNELKTFSKA